MDKQQEIYPKSKQIWLTSDQHWYHANIINLTKRPFKGVEEMNYALIKNYNAMVKENDEVYFLGDVGWKDTKKVVGCLRQLVPSKKYLLIGNHDHKNIKDEEFRSFFEWVKDYHELTYNSRLYVMGHYPFYSWRSSGHGAVNCHGHCHSNIDKVNENYYRIDCGVDNPTCKFSPISIEKIEAIMKAKKVEPHW